MIKCQKFFFFFGQQVAKVLSLDEVEIPCIKSWGNKKIRK